MLHPGASSSLNTHNNKSSEEVSSNLPAKRPRGRPKGPNYKPPPEQPRPVGCPRKKISPGNTSYGSAATYNEESGTFDVPALPATKFSHKSAEHQPSDDIISTSGSSAPVAVTLDLQPGPAKSSSNAPPDHVFVDLSEEDEEQIAVDETAAAFQDGIGRPHEMIEDDDVFAHARTQ
ncbi:hypothetical protein BT96DRAFT_991496 [Gymnopus androsaceus JB14]|uniref:Uncharacterized protein n=1 Tax=Gymnopus androsaceus JB14 TaxID=1447944 RepID=A0A6A4HWT0_9AGAR|nr:hypothetical protein BT96DRAFT_991496 [Gymnopus androsaceus JB14]